MRRFWCTPLLVNAFTLPFGCSTSLLCPLKLLSSTYFVNCKPTKNRTLKPHKRSAPITSNVNHCHISYEALHHPQACLSLSVIMPARTLAYHATCLTL